MNDVNIVNSNQLTRGHVSVWSGTHSIDPMVYTVSVAPGLLLTTVIGKLSIKMAVTVDRQ